MFLIPDILIVLFIILFLTRFDRLLIFRWVLFVLGILYLVHMYQTNNYTTQDLSISFINAVQGTISILVPTLLTIALALYIYIRHPWILYQKHSIFPKHIPPWMSITAYILVSIPIQEIVFRGLYLHHLGQNGIEGWLAIGIISFLFAILHAPFGGISLVVSTFIFGLIWSQNTLVYGTIFPSIISHTILGILVFVLSFLPPYRRPLNTKN